jgi:ribosomal-protein-alanine N-acetyltransferase
MTSDGSASPPAGPLRWPDRWPESGPVRLRPWRDDDLATVADLATDPYLPMIGTIPSPFTPAAGLAYVARQHARLTAGTGWSFAIALQATDRAVGGAGLWRHPEGPATAGYSVAPADRGHGYASAALAALVAFAGEVGETVVELLVEPANAASRAVAARAGFVEVELLPGHLVLGGVHRDALRCRRTVPPPSEGR